MELARGRHHFFFFSGIALVAAVVSSGCLKAEAKTPAATPVLVLDTPEPPARLLIPVTIEDPPAPTPTPTPTPAATPRPAIPGRTSPPPVSPPVVSPPLPEPTPVQPVLQTTSSVTELQARTKEKLDRADKDLARVSPNTLGKDARGQYDSAKRFIRMAKDAMTAKNFVQAAYCADKAATLAALLVK